MSEEEFEVLKEHVEHFRKNEGPHLQSYLMEKSVNLLEYHIYLLLHVYQSNCLAFNVEQVRWNE